MEKAKLIEAAKALNATVYEDETKDDVSPLIAQKIKITAVSDADLQTAFMEACSSIPEELERFIPDAVSDVYNAIGDEIEATGKATVSVPEPGVEKKAKSKLAKIKKVPQKEKSPSNKFKVYQKWSINKSESLDNLIKIAPGIKPNTIKAWVSAWNQGKNLPSGA